MDIQQKPTTYRQHWWIYACEIVNQNADGAVWRVPINVMVTTPTHQFTQAKLAGAQQAAQMRFREKHTLPEGAKTIDVFTYGISYLGHMSEKEFLAKKETH